MNIFRRTANPDMTETKFHRSINSKWLSPGCHKSEPCFAGESRYVCDSGAIVGNRNGVCDDHKLCFLRKWKAKCIQK